MKKLLLIALLATFTQSVSNIFAMKNNNQEDDNKRKYDEIIENNNENNDNNENVQIEEKIEDLKECAICLEEFNDEGHIEVKLQCNHSYCIPCLEEWIESQVEIRQENDHGAGNPSCPMCREEYPKNDLLELIENTLITKIEKKYKASCTAGLFCVGKTYGANDLFKAATRGCAACCFYWLNKGVNVNIKDRFGYGATSLSLACSNNRINVDVIKVLLDNGAVITDEIFSSACRQENTNIDIIKLLLDRGAHHQNALISYLSYPLQFKKIDIETIKFLLNKGAKTKNEDGTTVLHGLSSASHVTIEIIDFLFENDIDFTAQGTSGNTFLHAACHYRNTKIVQLVIDYIQKRLSDRNYANILNFICKIRPQFKEQAFALLLSLKRFQAETLKTKIQKYLIGMILLLVDNVRKNLLRDFINIKNKQGETALDLAIKYVGNEKIIEILNNLH